MKLNSFTLAALILVIMFGGISFSAAMNWWQTETTKIPATFTGGEAAGQYNPADIRGSYTFGDVSQLFNIPLADLQTAFRIPTEQDPAGFTLKSLETVASGLPVEVGTASVRLFVALYQGLPYDLLTGEETYLFPEAVKILQMQGRMNPDQAAYLESHIVPATPAETEPQADSGGETPRLAVTQVAPYYQTSSVLTPTARIPSENTITGQTTFQDLLDWGIPQEAIEAIIGDKMPSPQVIIKDFVTGKGLEFSSIKVRFQEEADKFK